MPLSTAAIADALRRARCERRIVDLQDAELVALTPDAARAVAHRLYEGQTADSAWKLGAIDDGTRQRLGLGEPLVAPVLAAGLHENAVEVRLDKSALVQPRLEAEIAVRVEGSHVFPVPCVEIADCRLPDWRLPPGWAIADFGLQGAMVFGPPGASLVTVDVDVVHDGRHVQKATSSWAEAVERLQLLPSSRRSADFTVATGAMTPLVDAATGSWEFRFKELGTLTLLIS